MYRWIKPHFGLYTTWSWLCTPSCFFSHSRFHFLICWFLLMLQFVRTLWYPHSREGLLRAGYGGWYRRLLTSKRVFIDESPWEVDDDGRQIVSEPLSSADHGCRTSQKMDIRQSIVLFTFLFVLRASICTKAGLPDFLRKVFRKPILTHLALSGATLSLVRSSVDLLDIVGGLIYVNCGF